ncbi:MAG: Glu/Leu/Phe/Val dehydrogenase [Cyanobacteria bacterium HKST-UBA04]|nr:Glu/Leu/Phe/Val dehydrogenase [Cyanobacteria bacterium HKST-UBA04]
MTIFKQLRQFEHENVVFCHDKETGLRAIIAIHNTTLGPALGGCRMKSYQSEDDALFDVLRLSRAMTFKSSLAGLHLGGGKSVVLLDHPEQKTPELLTAFARRINQLRGTYIGAGDIGSNTDDLRHMRQTCPWITGLAEQDGGLGDSAILTSLGVFMGLKAAVKYQLNRDDLVGLRISLQGLGKVGFMLLEKLVNAGCHVTVTDINPKAMERAKLEFPQIQTVSNRDIFSVEADIFSPNAIGGILTPQVAHNLPVSIVAGAANNVLLNDEAGEVLKQRHILYAPDFLINAGGVIMVASEIKGEGLEVARKKVETIYDRTLSVFERAAHDNTPPQQAAVAMAVERIEAARIDKARHEQRGMGTTMPETTMSETMVLETTYEHGDTKNGQADDGLIRS